MSAHREDFQMMKAKIGEMFKDNPQFTQIITVLSQLVESGQSYDEVDITVEAVRATYARATPATARPAHNIYTQ